jgi:hypothetical protein
LTPSPPSTPLPPPPPLPSTPSPPLTPPPPSHHLTISPPPHFSGDSTSSVCHSKKDPIDPEEGPICKREKKRRRGEGGRSGLVPGYCLVSCREGRRRSGSGNNTEEVAQGRRKESPRRGKALLLKCKRGATDDAGLTK